MNKFEKNVLDYRFELIVEMLSKSRVVITDRLDASVLSMLMDKPHVIVNDEMNGGHFEARNTREAAFKDRAECRKENLSGYYANDIVEALDKSVLLLDKND